MFWKYEKLRVSIFSAIDIYFLYNLNLYVIFVQGVEKYRKYYKRRKKEIILVTVTKILEIYILKNHFVKIYKSEINV